MPKPMYQYVKTKDGQRFVRIDAVARQFTVVDLKPGNGAECSISRFSATGLFIDKYSYVDSDEKEFAGNFCQVMAQLLATLPAAEGTDKWAGLNRQLVAVLQGNVLPTS